MGTNYYLYEEPSDFEDHAPGLHIGKSSAGWCFSLHVIPELGLNDLADWQVRWAKPGAVIRDEYGRDVTLLDMLATITERGIPGPRSHTRPPAWWYELNHAAPGPDGLVRHALGPYCVGHGAGPWDLIPGEFS